MAKTSKLASLTEKNFPLITEALIRALEMTYPLRLPRLKDTDREIWLAVGRQDVIEKLKQIRKAQTKSA